MTPYRVPEDPTRVAIESLKARPMHFVRRRMHLVARYRIVSAAPARAEWVEAARTLGLVQIGCACEGSASEFEKRIFVDFDRTTHAQISEARYLFATYFESGACILTWSHTPNTPSTDRLSSRAGTGDFGADYESHRRALAEKIENGEVPIRVTDIQAAVDLGDIYYRQIVPIPRAVLTLTTPLAAVVVFLVLAWPAFHHVFQR